MTVLALASNPSYHLLMRQLFFLFLLSSLCLAQSNRKQLFPLPTSLNELPTVATLSPELRTAIAPMIAASSCKPNGSEKYGVAEVDLQHEKITLVRIDEPCLCGPSGNCPIYAIQNGKVVLRDAEGFAYALSTNPKGGSLDLIIASHTSANVTSLQRYRWKGSRFKLEDCEAAVRKDLARDTRWNPEDL